MWKEANYFGQALALFLRFFHFLPLNLFFLASVELVHIQILAQLPLQEELVWLAPQALCARASWQQHAQRALLTNVTQRCFFEAHGQLPWPKDCKLSDTCRLSGTLYSMPAMPS